MKWIKKNILVIIAIFMILTIVLIYLLYDNSVYSQIKKEFRIDVTNCKKIKSKDTHGGFHGDGVLFAILDCSQSNETIINQIKEWDTLPITDESILLQFKRFQLDDFYNDEVKNYDILNKQNGFYYFKGKNQYDYGDYANFDIAIYDSDNFVFYYFEYDS